MFRQFAMARFMIGFITFILTYMVATFSTDNFFKLITVALFILSLYVMKEVKKGQLDELAKKDLEWQEKVNEIQDQLDQKEAECEFLIQAVMKAQEMKDN